MGAADAVVYAHWLAASYTVTFDPNGGTVSEQTRTVVKGDIYGALPTPRRTGYTFLGWYTAATGGTRVTGDNAPAADITLYAQWRYSSVAVGYVKYRIKLNLDGGTVAASYGELKYIRGYAKALPDATETTKPGYVFAGWYADASFSGSPVATIPSTATGTQTFYAKWL